MSVSKTTLKKLVLAIKKSRHKYVTVDRLSKATGLYPDVLTDLLVEFEPLIKFDATIDCRSLLPAMENRIDEIEKESPAKEKKIVVRKKELSAYPSIGDFVYSKFASIDGMIMPSVKLNDEDLHLLKKLVENEIQTRKKKNKSKAK